MAFDCWPSAIAASLSLREPKHQEMAAYGHLGILKQMGDTIAADLASAIAIEEAAIKEYDALMAAQRKEVDAPTTSKTN